MNLHSSTFLLQRYSPNHVVTLNLRGTISSTTISTLLAVEDTLFHLLLSINNLDDGSVMYLDLDPKAVEHVIEYLWRVKLFDRFVDVPFLENMFLYRSTLEHMNLMSDVKTRLSLYWRQAIHFVNFQISSERMQFSGNMIGLDEGKGWSLIISKKKIERKSRFVLNILNLGQNSIFLNVINDKVEGSKLYVYGSDKNSLGVYGLNCSFYQESEIKDKREEKSSFRAGDTVTFDVDITLGFIEVFVNGSCVNRIFSRWLMMQEGLYLAISLFSTDDRIELLSVDYE